MSIKSRVFAASTLIAGAVIFQAQPALGGVYVQTNLVSDIPGNALTTDPNLKNPWGIAFSATSPFWVSDQATGKSTLYTGTGSIVPLVVTIPAPPGPPPDGPTGVVFNSTTSGFQLPGPNSTTVKSTFIFDTLEGTIEGWNPGSTGGSASAVVMATTPGAVYTGLALAAPYLYAANYGSPGRIEVFDEGFNDVTNTTFAGKFVDPNPIPGFSPFNIQVILGTLYVTYAQLTPQGTPLPGGFVDQYDLSGDFIRRFTTMGPLNAPWGLALAPSTFGTFGGALLVGNFGDGTINAFNLGGTPLGTLTNLQGNPIVNPFLWAIAFGNGSEGSSPNTLYFTAGINNQMDGLFGSIETPNCGGGIDLSLALQNPLFAGTPGQQPTNWISEGSPAPGFASEAPGTAQYPGGSPFSTVASSPTTYAGSGTIRQLTGMTWQPGTYELALWAGTPETEPNGTSPVVGGPGAPNGRDTWYLTMGPGFGQVLAVDIPPAPSGTFVPNVITVTLPSNSPAIGQQIGLMGFVSATAYVAGNFAITACAINGGI